MPRVTSVTGAAAALATPEWLRCCDDHWNSRDFYVAITPELAMLPIGGHYTMGPREAALAVELLGVKHVLPIHYGTFPILAGTSDQLRAELAARGLGDVEVHALDPGETLT